MPTNPVPFGGTGAAILTNPFATSDLIYYWNANDTCYSNIAGTTVASVGDLVGFIPDLSPNGNNLIPFGSSLIRRPTLATRNGKRYWEFDGVDDSMITPAAGATGIDVSSFTLLVGQLRGTETYGGHTFFEAQVNTARHHSLQATGNNTAAFAGATGVGYGAWINEQSATLTPVMRVLTSDVVTTFPTTSPTAGRVASGVGIVRGEQGSGAAAYPTGGAAADRKVAMGSAVSGTSGRVSRFSIVMLVNRPITPAELRSAYSYMWQEMGGA